MLVIVAQARNDHKIASTGGRALGRKYFHGNIVPRLFLAASGSFETLFVWKQERNSRRFLKDKVCDQEL